MVKKKKKKVEGLTCIDHRNQLNSFIGQVKLALSWEVDQKLLITTHAHIHLMMKKTAAGSESRGKNTGYTKYLSVKDCWSYFRINLA